MNAAQLSLFHRTPPLPEAFDYRPELLSAAEEGELVDHLRDLPFKEFEFRGYRGRRRVVSFGMRYDFNGAGIKRARDIPAFLVPLRQRCTRFAGLPDQALEHVLVTEYAPGAGIGWHRDRPVFADVVGVSLLSSCRLRLRRKAGGSWERRSVVLEPRSAYLLRGAVRTEWEHSIPAMESLRYSITFRSLKAGTQAQ